MSCESALDACGQQCDQIGRIFALWATIQSREQQLFYPNRPHCYTIFVKVSKSIIFLVKSFLGNFYRHLAIFIWSHCFFSSLSFFCVETLNCWFGDDDGDDVSPFSDEIRWNFLTFYKLIFCQIVALRTFPSFNIFVHLFNCFNSNLPCGSVCLSQKITSRVVTQLWNNALSLVKTCHKTSNIQS